MVNIDASLPFSQGFGMSAAACLSAAYATAECLGISKIQALYAAHTAEVRSRTGLGDVIASYHGGVEYRNAPGVTSPKNIHTIPADLEIVLCIIGPPMSTQSILSDKKKMKIIQSIGNACVDTLEKKPTIDQFFQLAWNFTKNTGLATKSILDAIAAVQPYGQASMCMLGNAVFATGDNQKISEALESYGHLIYVKSERMGVRIIK
jgi:pantoate kinase